MTLTCFGFPIQRTCSPIARSATGPKWLPWYPMCNQAAASSSSDEDNFHTFFSAMELINSVAMAILSCCRITSHQAMSLNRVLYVDLAKLSSTVSLLPSLAHTFVPLATVCIAAPLVLKNWIALDT